jgi:outer membrane immunogenic protein
MRKILFAGIAATAFCSTPALAAPPSMYSWTGCYIGGNVGGAWSKARFTDEDNFFVPTGQPLGSSTASGFAGGGQIGCDYQFANNWVTGIQGMLDGASLKGSTVLAGGGNNVLDTKINEFGTVTGRLGYLINPSLLFYGKAGVGWLDDKFSCTSGAYCGFSTTFFSGSQSRSGFDLGAGASWMFMPNWDVWIEWDHMYLGNKTENLTHALTFTSNVHQDLDKILVGIDYRFGGH